MRVIADRPVQEPDNIGHSQIFFESVVILLARHARVAHLDFGVKITFFSREQRSPSVQLNAAAFHHKIFSIEFRIEQFLFENARRGFGNFAVLLPIIIFRPGIEMKMDDRRFPFPRSAFRVPRYKDRPAVQPRLVG